MLVSHSQVRNVHIPRLLLNNNNNKTSLMNLLVFCYPISPYHLRLFAYSNHWSLTNLLQTKENIHNLHCWSERETLSMACSKVPPRCPVKAFLSVSVCPDCLAEGFSSLNSLEEANGAFITPLSGSKLKPMWFKIACRRVWRWLKFTTPASGERNAKSTNRCNSTSAPILFASQFITFQYLTDPCTLLWIFIIQTKGYGRFQSELLQVFPVM